MSFGMKIIFMEQECYFMMKIKKRQPATERSGGWSNKLLWKMII
jgi:hypothetical protein